MLVKFFGQGLCEGVDATVGDELNTSIANPNFSCLEVYVAFVSTRAANYLVEKITISSSLTAKIYVGVDLQGTSKEALELLLKCQRVEAFIFYTTSPPIYHPKVYVFRGLSSFRVIIGSSNLTSSGMFSNIEASTCIDFSTGDVDGENFLKQLDAFFKPIVGKMANVQVLCQKTIDMLHAAGIVPTEAQQRENRKGKQPNKVLSPSSSGLAGLFPTRKTTPIPLAKAKAKQVAQSDAIVTVHNPLDPVASPVSKNGQSKSKEFWIQTGSLTGGSRNQLDLSIVSAHGQLSHGSLSLFGINSVNTSVATAITFRYQGVDYFENHIKYPQTAYGETNGTWRLQMNGRSKLGNRLTTLCRDNFIQVILVFTELEKNHYEIVVHQLGELNAFKAKSVLWDQNRPQSTGRHFGQL